MENTLSSPRVSIFEGCECWFGMCVIRRPLARQEISPPSSTSRAGRGTFAATFSPSALFSRRHKKTTSTPFLLHTSSISFPAAHNVHYHLPADWYCSQRRSGIGGGEALGIITPTILVDIRIFARIIVCLPKMVSIICTIRWEENDDSMARCDVWRSEIVFMLETVRSRESMWNMDSWSSESSHHPRNQHHKAKIAAKNESPMPKLPPKLVSGRNCPRPCRRDCSHPSTHPVLGLTEYCWFN